MASTFTKNEISNMSDQELKKAYQSALKEKKDAAEDRSHKEVPSYVAKERLDSAVEYISLLENEMRKRNMKKESNSPKTKKFLENVTLEGSDPSILNNFKREDISTNVINRYKRQYRNLVHIRITKNTKGYIYTKDSQVIGIINTERKSDGKVWIQALEVFGDNKRKGIGYALLDVAVKQLHARWLSVRKTNTAAINLYKKYGFNILIKKTDDTMYYMYLESAKTKKMMTDERKSILEGVRSMAKDTQEMQCVGAMLPIPGLNGEPTVGNGVNSNTIVDMINNDNRDIDNDRISSAKDMDSWMKNSQDTINDISNKDIDLFASGYDIPRNIKRDILSVASYETKIKKMRQDKEPEKNINDLKRRSIAIQENINTYKKYVNPSNAEAVTYLQKEAPKTISEAVIDTYIKKLVDSKSRHECKYRIEAVRDDIAQKVPHDTSHRLNQSIDSYKAFMINEHRQSTQDEKNDWLFEYATQFYKDIIREAKRIPEDTFRSSIPDINAMTNGISKVLYANVGEEVLKESNLSDGTFLDVTASKNEILHDLYSEKECLKIARILDTRLSIIDERAEVLDIVNKSIKAGSDVCKSAPLYGKFASLTEGLSHEDSLNLHLAVMEDALFNDDVNHVEGVKMEMFNSKMNDIFNDTTFKEFVEGAKSLRTLPKIKEDDDYLSESVIETKDAIMHVMESYQEWVNTNIETMNNYWNSPYIMKIMNKADSIQNKYPTARVHIESTDSYKKVAAHLEDGISDYILQDKPYKPYVNESNFSRYIRSDDIRTVFFREAVDTLNYYYQEMINRKEMAEILTEKFKNKEILDTKSVYNILEEAVRCDKYINDEINNIMVEIAKATYMPERKITTESEDKDKNMDDDVAAYAISDDAVDTSTADIIRGNIEKLEDDLKKQEKVAKDSKKYTDQNKVEGIKAKIQNLKEKLHLAKKHDEENKKKKEREEKRKQKEKEEKAKKLKEEALDSFDYDNDIFTEKANLDPEIAETVEILNKKGYHVKYASAGHTKLRKKEDKDDKDVKENEKSKKAKGNTDSDGVYYDHLYSDARVMFDDNYNFSGDAPKYWHWRIVDGCSYLDITPLKYDKKLGTPDEAFEKWKDNYMYNLRNWANDLEPNDKAGKNKEDEDDVSEEDALDNFIGIDSYLAEATELINTDDDSYFNEAPDVKSLLEDDFSGIL